MVEVKNMLSAEVTKAGCITRVQRHEAWAAYSWPVSESLQHFLKLANNMIKCHRGNFRACICVGRQNSCRIMGPEIMTHLNDTATGTPNLSYVSEDLCNFQLSGCKSLITKYPFQSLRGYLPSTQKASVLLEYLTSPYRSPSFLSFSHTDAAYGL